MLFRDLASRRLSPNGFSGVLIGQRGICVELSLSARRPVEGVPVPPAILGVRHDRQEVVVLEGVPRVVNRRGRETEVGDELLNRCRPDRAEVEVDESDGHRLVSEGVRQRRPTVVIGVGGRGRGGDGGGGIHRGRVCRICRVGASLP